MLLMLVVICEPLSSNIITLLLFEGSVLIVVLYLPPSSKVTI